MKKIVLSIAALFVFVATFAQTKGEKYIAATASASFGSQDVATHNVLSTDNAKSPLGSTISIQGELGVFIADKVRVGLAIGVPFTSTPTTQSGSDWLYAKTLGINITPNLAFYGRITDSFFYAPELGFAYETGRYEEDVVASYSFDAKYSGWGVSANLLSFEFRINPQIALGVSAGALSYLKVTVKADTSAANVTTTQRRFDLNNGTLCIRRYF